MDFVALKRFGFRFQLVLAIKNHFKAPLVLLAPLAPPVRKVPLVLLALLVSMARMA